MHNAEGQAEQALRRLYQWMERRDFRGYDPHDLLESPVVGPLLRQVPVLRLVAVQLGRRSPIDLHTLFKVPRRFNPKTGALLINGLLRARDRVDPRWEDHVRMLIQRVLDSSVKTPHGRGWGYPFAWQSRTHYLPANFPTIVATSFVCQALLDAHEAGFTSDAILLALTQAADYILLDVSRAMRPEGVAFGYAQDDPQIVFNASLLGAAVLGRLGALLGEQPYLEQAREATRFAVAHQNRDGSWYYGLEPSQQWIDSFHTGYNLTALHSLSRSLGVDLSETVRTGYSYYREKFIDNGRVRYSPNKPYPIDTHAAAQGILTTLEHGDLNIARDIARWMIVHMQSPKGYFYYQQHRNYTNRIPYMRWSNAWMFRALSELVIHEDLDRP